MQSHGFFAIAKLIVRFDVVQRGKLSTCQFFVHKYFAYCIISCDVCIVCSCSLLSPISCFLNIGGEIVQYREFECFVTEFCSKTFDLLVQ